MKKEDVRRWRLLLAAGLLVLSSGSHAATILTLEDCLQAALTGNHDLQALEWEAEGDAARAEGARRDRYPELTLTGNWQSHTEATRVGTLTPDGPGGTFSHHLWQGGAGLVLPLYTGGKLEARERVESYLAQAASLDTRAFREQLAVQVAEVYHGLLAVDALIQSLERSREALAAQEAQIKALIREDKAAEVDLLRVQVRMASLQQQWIEVRNEAAILRETMNLLTARPARSDWQPADGLGDPGLFPRVPETDPRHFAERSDEQAARQRQLAAKSLTEAARSGYRPSMQLEASWNLRRDWEGRDSFDDGIVGLSINWSLWDFGRTREEVLESQSRERAQEERLAAIQSRRQFEWEQARDSLQAARERVEVARLSVESAREALRIEQRKYDSGKGLITDVLSSEAAALEAESLLARARADHLNALARSDFARGSIFRTTAWLPAFRTPEPLSPSIPKHPASK